MVAIDFLCKLSSWRMLIVVWRRVNFFESLTL